MAVRQIERREIVLFGQSLCYTWEKKAVKNCNLRVKPGGEICVSTPRHITAAFVERFLAEKQEFLRRALARAAQRAEQPTCSLAQGEQIPIFGETHTVIHEKAARPQVRVAQGSLILALPDPKDAQARKRAFLRFAKDRVTAMTRELTDTLFLLVPGLERPPEIGVRDMKSRFGSCFYTQGRVCYSTNLIFLPPVCVKMIVCHELAHFLRHDHSKAFYAALGRLMPEHAEARRVLRAFPIPRLSFT